MADLQHRAGIAALVHPVDVDADAHGVVPAQGGDFKLGVGNDDAVAVVSLGDQPHALSAGGMERGAGDRRHTPFLQAEHGCFGGTETALAMQRQGIVAGHQAKDLRRGQRRAAAHGGK